jgi:hypothetical protein
MDSRVPKGSGGEESRRFDGEMGENGTDSDVHLSNAKKAC